MKFSRIIRSAIFMITGVASANIVCAQKKTDSVTIAVAPEYDKVGKLHRFFLGENYRKLWATPVKMRVFSLATEKGGLKIIQRGGGMQSKSLRLQDSSGQQWVIRTVQKYPEKNLPPNLRASVAKDILQDQICTENPFAAVTVPPFAQALGIPHANPEIVYIPDDPSFGGYRKDFANQVFLFEEREPLDADKTDNTEKTQKRLQNDNDNRVDQKTVLRARLLDMLLNDWDRHEDQWRWERIKDKDGKGGSTYEPVPRDRDQVYYTTSGVFPWLLSRYLLMAKFQNFGNHIRSINRWNRNARYFDRYFLTGLNEQDWISQIDTVQTVLTDVVIKNAVKKMPANIYAQCGDATVKLLIARRDVLKQQALSYFHTLSKAVDVPESDKREYFDITNQPDGKLSVKINKLKKDGSKEQELFNRVFDPAYTNEVRLYGMGGNDIFAVHGKNSSPIKVRMIGGDDKDTFLIDSNITSKGNRYVYDRADQKNNLPDKSRAHLCTSTDSTVNSFNSKSFKYDFLQPLLLANYNNDYGLQLIGQFNYEQHGFRKEPYSSRQTLMINYGLGVSSLLINYKGDFKKVAGNNDLLIDVTSKGPNYVSNFFGVGNETEFVNSGRQKIKYYRNVYNYFSSDVRIKHIYGNFTASAGIRGQYYNGDADDNTNRYLNIYDAQHSGENVFGSQGYVGVGASLVLDTRDKSTLPHSGVLWTTNLGANKGFGLGANNYGQVLSEFGFYVTPAQDSVFIVSSRFGLGTTFGNAAYYQQLKLGGAQNLRGFYANRFTGKTVAYNSVEMRLRVLDFNSYLFPGTFGVIGFNDVGRVWTPQETSTQWHDGYGGGVYLIPAQLILIEGVVGFSKEGAFPYFSIGFKF